MTEDLTDEELKMLDADTREWDAEEKSALKSQAYFTQVGEAARKTAENMARIVEAGDHAETRHSSLV